MPLSSSNAGRQLSDGNSQGTFLGISASDKIGFYQASSGVAQAVIIGANSATTNVAAINATTASVTAWAYASSTQANAISAAVNQLFLMGLIA